MRMGLKASLHLLWLMKAPLNSLLGFLTEQKQQTTHLISPLCLLQLLKSRIQVLPSLTTLSRLSSN